jgi:putative oxidoreductase
MISLGLLVLRVAVGLTIAGHGAQKLFGWWGGGGIGGTARMFDAIGFRPGRATAVLGGVAEAGGGLSLALGLFTPLGSLAVVSMMLGAIIAVHRPKGWWNQNGGMEFPTLIGVIALVLVLTGPGRYSLDRALGLDWAGPAWAVAVLLAALVSGGAIIFWLRTTRTDAGAVPTAAPERTPSSERARS